MNNDKYVGDLGKSNQLETLEKALAFANENTGYFDLAMPCRAPCAMPRRTLQIKNFLSATKAHRFWLPTRIKSPVVIGLFDLTQKGEAGLHPPAN